MKPLVVQFSGGNTSRFLRVFCGEHFKGREIITLFENTGKEHPKTLEFVDRCDRYYGWNVVWLEAEFHERGIAPTHRVVNFESASRNGEPYEALIAKHGIQNMAYKDCTKYLKVLPKDSYLRSIGVTDYETAIGIRADEAHRRSQKQKQIIYPLIDIVQVNKKFIESWSVQQEVRLEVPKGFGNCDFCFKKSIRHLVENVKAAPEKLVWWAKMERKYGSVGAPLEPRKFFRGHLSAQDLLALASEPTLFDNPEYEVETDCFCKSS